MARDRSRHPSIGNPHRHPETLRPGYGYDPALSEGAVKPPVFLTSTFVFAIAVAGLAGCLVCPLALAQPVIYRLVAHASPPAYDGPCPAVIAFTGTIFVHHPARVSYRWERSDGAAEPVETVQIDDADIDVKTEWQLATPRGQVLHGSEVLHILSPGDFYSNPAQFTLVCR
jgi:hypothetical protein